MKCLTMHSLENRDFPISLDRQKSMNVGLNEFPGALGSIPKMKGKYRYEWISFLAPGYTLPCGWF
jgi:hypothetical protein